MDIRTPQFSPVFDRQHFPILAGAGDEPTSTLLGCSSISFSHVPDAHKKAASMAQPGRLWHEYGDARWPSEAVWLEFDPTAAGYRSLCGVLILRAVIPANQTDVFTWIAANSPHLALFVDLRGDEQIHRNAEMLKNAQVAPADGPGPDDEVPAYVQAYCIFRKRGEEAATLEARYTDILNSSGAIIPRYRTMLGEAKDLDFRRHALHTVCAINAERIKGMAVDSVTQLMQFVPVRLENGDIGPEWARFHPMRSLRTRPAVRAFPVTGALVQGAISLEAMERISDVHRVERNRHMVAFDRDSRPHFSIEA